MFRGRDWMLAAAAAALIAVPCHGQKNRRYAVTDPAKAGPDFAVQGEYVGEVERDNQRVTLGVQVIALGGGKFHAVAYWGGLPGAGWDGSERIEADGRTENGVTTFSTDQGSGRIKDGLLTIYDSEGGEVGQLRKVVRKSPTLGMKPPEGAVVLFDGTSADQFQGGRMTNDGLLMVGTVSKRKFGSCKLHLEFCTPFMPYARGQGRGNSGCYLQGRYEVQILDSFGLAGRNNECGGLYGVRDPDVNMCLPPLSWQTYDIDFTAAKYDRQGKKVKNPVITVRHNGVLIHKDVELPGSTRGFRVPEGPQRGPLYLQNHGCPVRFRNIWVLEKQ